MEIIRRVHSMREIARQVREQKLRVGFVPTMGALHEGHLSLIRAAQEAADVAVVSIFVNPTQFGPQEDFERYPRSLTEDADRCVTESVDYLFTPEVREIYPPGPAAVVEVQGISERLEGASRPSHFRGVATVVLKLLEIVRPHVAVFGQKDAQQAAVVRRMIEDLLLDVELVVGPTVRDADGLALSSRNRFLTSEERRAATALPRALEAARQTFDDGTRDGAELVAAARAVLDAEPGLRVDYLELVDGATFEAAAKAEPGALLVAAVFAGTTRLLDNRKLPG